MSVFLSALIHFLFPLCKPPSPRPFFRSLPFVCLFVCAFDVFPPCSVRRGQRTDNKEFFPAAQILFFLTIFLFSAFSRALRVDYFFIIISLEYGESMWVIFLFLLLYPSLHRFVFAASIPQMSRIPLTRYIFFSSLSCWAVCCSSSLIQTAKRICISLLPHTTYTMFHTPLCLFTFLFRGYVVRTLFVVVGYEDFVLAPTKGTKGTSRSLHKRETKRNVD